MTSEGTARELRKFGIMVGGIFCLIGLWPALFRGQPPRAWALIIGVLLLAPALTKPRLLAPVYRVWMLVGETLGWINTRILLGVVFYLVITPMGIVRRLLGKNTIRRSFEPDVQSYRVVKRARPGTHMTRQF
jgi:Saxitoxin biosynthesis operon protein SxtJ